MKYKIERLFFDIAQKQQQFLLILIGIVFYLPYIGNVHLFDWDEINFAEITREMLVTGEYFRSQVDFTSFYEKPPLFNWLQIIFFSIFGVNEFAARFPNALFGIFSLLLIFNIGKDIRDKTFGMLWALLYLGSFLPHFYFKLGVIDPVFNFFIFASAYLVYKAYKINSNKIFLFAGLINGISVITKGPVGLLIVALTILVYELSYVRKWSWQRVKQYIIFGLGVLGVTLIWLLPQFIIEGTTFITNFTEYMIELLTQDVAMQGQPFYYHFLVLFIGCFPISIMALGNVCNLQRKTSEDFTKWMFVLFWVVLLLFSSVTTKIIHYSSMCYFPLAYLATDALTKFRDKLYVPKPYRILYLILGSIYASIFIAIPIVFYNKNWILHKVQSNIFTLETIKILDIPFAISVFGGLFLVTIIVVFILLSKGKILKGIVIHSLLFALFFNGILALLMPPIEKAVQGSAINFYKRFQGKDVYVTTIGFKSYGKTYYSKKQQQKPYSDNQFLNNTFDKPVYYVTHVGRKPPLSEEYDGIEFVERQSNFILYVKMPKNE